MKKIFIFILVSVFSCLFISCDDYENLDEINESYVVINQGEKYTFDIEKEVLLSADDNSIIAIDGKTIEGINLGMCILKIVLKNNEDVFKEVVIEVKENEINLDEITDDNLVLNIGNKYKIKTNKDIKVEVSDLNLLSYNENTKEIEAIDIGKCYIVVFLKADMSMYKLINIIVDFKIDNLNIEIKDDETYTFDIRGSVILESRDENILKKIDDNAFLAMNVGTTQILVKSKYDDRFREEINVDVVFSGCSLAALMLHDYKWAMASLYESVYPQELDFFEELYKIDSELNFDNINIGWFNGMYSPTEKVYCDGYTYCQVSDGEKALEYISYFEDLRFEYLDYSDLKYGENILWIELYSNLLNGHVLYVYHDGTVIYHYSKNSQVSSISYNFIAKFDESVDLKTIFEFPLIND